MNVVNCLTVFSSTQKHNSSYAHISTLDKIRIYRMYTVFRKKVYIRFYIIVLTVFGHIL